MKNILTLLIPVAMLLSTAAFQVNKNDVALKSKIRQTTDLIKGNSVVYTYNPDGRIALIKGKKASTSYEYHGNVIIKKLIDATGEVKSTDSMIVNGKGLVTKLYMNKTSPNFADEITIDYDMAGYCVADRHIYMGKMRPPEELKYIKGNATTLIQNSEDGKPNVLYYSYYSDHFNTIGDDNMGMTFKGHSSRNALKETMNIQAIGDTIRATCYYHYDDMGRIIIKACYSKSNLTDSTGYSYY